MSSYLGQTTGVLTQSYGALVQGKQTSDTLNQQAKIQRQNRDQAILAAKFNADRQSTIATRQMGGISAGYAANGVDQTSGSALAVMAASAANAEMDRQNIMHGGEIRAINFENQAKLDEVGASNAVQASYFNVLSSVIGGGKGMYKGFGGPSNQNMYTTDLSRANDIESGSMVDSTGGDEDLVSSVV